MPDDEKPPLGETTGSREPRPFRFSDERQERIYRRLSQLVGPGPAAYFRDACRIFATEPSYDTATHLVAHLVREIESALRSVFDPEPEPIENTEFEGIIAKHEIPPEGPIAADLRAFVDKNLTGGKHLASIRAALEFLSIPETEPLAKAWLETGKDQSPYSHHRFAHRDNLNAPRPLDSDFQAFWERFQAIFDDILNRFETQYPKLLAAIDELRKKSSPTNTDVKLLVKILPNTPNAHERFLAPPTAAAWLPHLRKKRFFAHPPSEIIDRDKGLLSYPPWPEARYLARIAGESATQNLVAEVLSEIPLTNNASVHFNLAQAALALPPELAMAYAEQEAAWIEQQEFLPLGILAVEFAKLAARLADALHVTQAIALLRALLLPRQTDTTSRRTRSRIGTWEYGEVLTTAAPTLTKKATIAFVSLLLECLRADLGGKETPDEKREAGTSFIWREAIETDEDPGLNEPREVLISTLRDAMIQAYAGDPRLLPQLLELLDIPPIGLYQRLALHLLRKTGTDGTAYVAQQLTNQPLLQSVAVRHEYTQLLHDKFRAIPHDDQERIIDLIRQGPQVEHLRGTQHPATGMPWTEDEIRFEQRSWTRDLLSLIQDDLSGGIRKEYDDLVAELGQPSELAQFPVHRGKFSGAVSDTSPKTDDEIKAMSIDQVLEFLASWQPTGDFFAPNRDGVAEQLKRVIAEQPVAYAQQASHFANAHPSYVRGIVDGFQEAVGKNKEFDWEPVLTLCQQTIDQPGTESGDTSLAHRRSWVRQATERLITTGLKEMPAAIPFGLRAQVWSILETLAADPDPANDVGTDDASIEKSHFDTAINSIRGSAIERVLDYAVWTKKHLLNLGDETVAIAQLPEVRLLLEQHLDPNEDPALPIRSVYGVHLHRLFYLDPAWATSIVPKIFPADLGLRALDREAWTSFLVFGTHNAYRPMYEALQERYDRAVTDLASQTDQPVSPFSAPANLGHNIVNLYLAGLIDLRAAESLINRYFATAGDHARANAISWIGSSLRQATEPATPVVMLRLREFWEHRVATITATGATERSTKELLAFSSWFASGAWPEDWAADQLLTVYQLTGQAPAEYWVIAHLPMAAKTEPLRAIKILHAIADASLDGTDMIGQTNELRDTLTEVLLNGNEEAKTVARDTLGRLIAKGRRDLDDLIPPPD